MAIIQKNEYAIRQMNAQTANTPSSVATAESMIQDMKQKLENLIETSGSSTRNTSATRPKTT